MNNETLKKHIAQYEEELATLTRQHDEMNQNMALIRARYQRVLGKVEALKEMEEPPCES